MRLVKAAKASPHAKFYNLSSDWEDISPQFPRVSAPQWSLRMFRIALGQAVPYCGSGRQKLANKTRKVCYIACLFLEGGKVLGFLGLNE